MSKSLNKVTLLGNVTADVESKEIGNGTTVASFSVATNRDWTEKSGEKKTDTQFHRVVVWDKLADICSRMLHKGSKVYLEGRLATRKWTDKEGMEQHTTEIIANDMILLDKKE